MTIEMTTARGSELTGAELLAVAADPIRWTLLTRLAAAAPTTCAGTYSATVTVARAAAR